MTKVDHVDAVFGGEQLRFRLAPEALPVFEREIRGSAHQCFLKISGGFWTFAEVEAVLAAALPAPRRADGSIIQRALCSRPPAAYAILAAWILEAALFGIEDSLAIFDENAAEAA